MPELTREYIEFTRKVLKQAGVFPDTVDDICDLAIEALDRREQDAKSAEAFESWFELNKASLSKTFTIYARTREAWGAAVAFADQRARESRGEIVWSGEVLCGTEIIRPCSNEPSFDRIPGAGPYHITLSKLPASTPLGDGE